MEFDHILASLSGCTVGILLSSIAGLYYPPLEINEYIDSLFGDRKDYAPDLLFKRFGRPVRRVMRFARRGSQNRSL